MTDNEKQQEARNLVASPLFRTLLADMDAVAVAAVLSAHDDYTRRERAAEARAIRNFRAKVESLASGPAPALGKQAPA